MKLQLISILGITLLALSGCTVYSHASGNLPPSDHPFCNQLKHELQFGNQVNNRPAQQLSPTRRAYLLSQYNKHQCALENDSQTITHTKQ